MCNELDDWFDQLEGSRILCETDLKSVYHLLKPKPEDIPKTTFSSRPVYFEFMVKSFRMTNTPVALWI